MSKSKAWPHSNSVPVLIRQAERDSDPASLFTAGLNREREQLAVVILKGNATVQLFREWAARNGVLTEGKDVTT